MISTLAKMLRLSDEQAEASMFSEGAARAVLGRRNLMLAGAALVAGTAFSFGHAAMSPREFQDLVRASLPGRQVSFGPGQDIYSDSMADPRRAIVARSTTVLISGGNRKSSRFSVDMSQLDTSPFVRERLQRALQRHAGFSAACFG